MGVKLAVVLCLSLALFANAQQLSSLITDDLAAKENQLNCLLGKPNCVSPPPPPGTPVPPPASAPPPGTTPPAPAPSTTPTLAPTPAPGPAALGTALVVISLSFPNYFVVTDDVRAKLVALIQAELGSDAVVQLQITGGRKLLQISTITLLITEIKDCVDIGLRLEFFIPNQFVKEAEGEGYPLQSATLNVYTCSFPGQNPYDITNPPALAPGSGPAASPSGSGPASGPGGPTSGPTTPAHAPSPVPAPQ